MRCRVLGIAGLAVGLCLAYANSAAAASLAATTAAATRPAGAAPVLRGLSISDAGYFADMEIQNPDGSTSRVLLKNGDVLEWNHTRILDITPGHIRVSRPVPPEGGAAWLDIKIGYNMEGQRIPPQDAKPEPAASGTAATRGEVDAAAIVKRALPAVTQPAPGQGILGGNTGLPVPDMQNAAVLDPRDRERLTAIQELASLGPRAAPAIPGLIELLGGMRGVQIRDSSEKGYHGVAIASAASGVLIKIGAESLPAVRKLLVDPKGNALARRRAADIMAMMHFTGGRSFSGQFTRYPVEDADLEAWEALVDDGDAFLRASAAHCLTEAKDVQGLPALLNYAEDKDGKVSTEAARGLGLMRSAEAVPVLIKYAPGKTALDALTAIGAPAVEPLIDLLARAGVKEAQAGKPDFSDSDRLGLALFEMNDPKAHEVMRKHLGDESPVVRRWLATALANRVADRSEILLRMLADRDAGVRASVAGDLVHYCEWSRYPVAVEALKKVATEDKEEKVRDAATRARDRMTEKLDRESTNEYFYQYTVTSGEYRAGWKALLMKRPEESAASAKLVLERERTTDVDRVLAEGILRECNDLLKARTQPATGPAPGK